MKNVALRKVVWTGTGLVATALLLGACVRIGDWMGQTALETAIRTKTPEDELDVRYANWKTAHTQSVAQLMSFYAPDAVIIRETGAVETYADLQNLAMQVRRMGTFSDVRDLAAPQRETIGEEVVMKVRHRYGHLNGSFAPLAGDRVLTWAKENGKWLIVRDQFPPRYTAISPRATRRSVEIIKVQ